MWRVGQQSSMKDLGLEYNLCEFCGGKKCINTLGRGRVEFDKGGRERVPRILPGQERVERIEECYGYETDEDWLARNG